MSYNAADFLAELDGPQPPATVPPAAAVDATGDGPRPAGRLTQGRLDLDAVGEPRPGDRLHLGRHGVWVRVPGAWERVPDPPRPRFASPAPAAAENGPADVPQDASKPPDATRNTLEPRGRETAR